MVQNPGNHCSVCVLQPAAVVQEAKEDTPESEEEDWEAAAESWEDMDAVPAIGPAAEEAKRKVNFCPILGWPVVWCAVLLQAQAAPQKACGNNNRGSLSYQALHTGRLPSKADQ